MNTEVTEENIEYYLGTKDIEYKEALASESGVGSIAHSVVLVRMKDGSDIEDAKQKILMSKRELEQMIFNRIKDYIGYKMNDYQDIIEAVIYVGKKEK